MSGIAGDGEGIGSSSRSGDDADLDITPMIDVTFLLLIFFMVTSTMQPPPSHDVPSAKNGIGADSASIIEIGITAPDTADGPGTIMIDGKEASLEEVRRHVREQMELGKTHVCVMADRDVPEGTVMELERAVAEEDGIALLLGVRDR